MKESKRFNPAPRSTKKDSQGKTPISREELDQAMQDFLRQGGKVKQVEPLWIEDTASPGYQSRH